MVSMGRRIMQLRKAKNITQKELGEAVGVSIQAVSKWEHGGAPDIDMIPRIAAFFDVSISELFGGDKESAADLSSVIFDRLCSAPREERSALAEEYIWAVFRGAAGYRSAKNTLYTPSPAFGSDNNCTRCQIDYDELIANACVTEKFRYFFFMPEPQGGYDAALLSSAEYAEIFKELADRELIDVFLFAARKNDVPFSLPHASAELGLDEKIVEEKLAFLVEHRQMTTMTVALDNGMRTLYRFTARNIMLVPALLMLRELVYPAINWHLINYDRTKPILGGQK